MSLETMPEIKAYSRYSRLEYGQVVATPLADHINFREFSNLHVDLDYPEFHVQKLINALFERSFDDDLLKVAVSLDLDQKILLNDWKLFYTAGSRLVEAIEESKRAISDDDKPAFAITMDYPPSTGDDVFGFYYMQNFTFRNFYEDTSKLSPESFENTMGAFFNTWYYVAHVPKIFVEAYNKIPTVKPLEDLKYFRLRSIMSSKRDRINALVHFRRWEVLQNSVSHSNKHSHASVSEDMENIETTKKVLVEEYIGPAQAPVHFQNLFCEKFQNPSYEADDFRDICRRLEKERTPKFEISKLDSQVEEISEC